MKRLLPTMSTALSLSLGAFLFAFFPEAVCSLETDGRLKGDRPAKHCITSRADEKGRHSSMFLSRASLTEGFESFSVRSEMFFEHITVNQRY